MTTARALLCVTLLALATAAPAQTVLPPGFQETNVFTGLVLPTVVKFSSDGRVFVAEKRGIIKMFDNLQDTTPTTVIDIRTNVFNFWDRGLLGMALHPNFPASPYVYVLYTLDKKPGGTIPSWGVAGADDDNCPDPPGSNTDGCTVTARLSRFSLVPNVVLGPLQEQVFIDDWCQQFPSHSIGSLVFGEDGALYVTGGEGANFEVTDYGQLGGTLNPSVTPKNPCGDPPGGAGGAMTPPSAMGGALRSQSRQRPSGPTVFSGTVLRLNPETGAAHATNPLVNHPDVKKRSIVADGLRNPFRAAWRPGTNELWVGDVGWIAWEEINIVNPTAVRNFGWPCFEGEGIQDGYAAVAPVLTLCKNLYDAPGSVTAPFMTYFHAFELVPGEACTMNMGSAVAGLAFHPLNGPYPQAYRGALFFTDYNRRCIWAMLPNGGTPDKTQVQNFASALPGGAVALETGPNGDLFFVDFDLGRVARISYSAGNTPPTSSFTATPQNGPAPLTVLFDGSNSSDPEGQSLAYAWDLNGDNVFTDATGVTTSRTYTNPGNYTVRLRVTDTGGASATSSKVISAGNTPPTASIALPLASLKWKVGDVIAFQGSASDPQGPASLLWTLKMVHCSTLGCHDHVLTTFTTGTGSFTAPDHEYPSHLELTLVATDAGGLTDTKTVSLDPQTVDLTFNTSPAGLQLGVNSTSQTAPFTRTVIIGSVNSMSAPSPQTLNATTYAFSGWSDSGAQTHTVTAPATATAYTATYNLPLTATIVSPAANVTINAGQSVSFVGGGTGTITGYNWTFAGGTPASSTIQNPVVTYSTPGSYTASLTVTGNGGVTSSPVSRTITVGGFTLSATPSSRTVAAGANAAYTVSVAAASGFTGTVAFSVSGLPAGASASFIPPSVTTSGPTTLTVSTTAVTTPAGTYPLTVTGTAGTLTRTVNLTLVVSPPIIDFSLDVSPLNATVQRAGNTIYNVTIGGQAGSGNITLSVQGVPKFAGARFSPSSVNGAGTATLTIDTKKQVAVGQSTLTITATRGSVVKTQSVTLTVTQ